MKANGSAKGAVAIGVTVLAVISGAGLAFAVSHEQGLMQSLLAYQLGGLLAIVGGLLFVVVVLHWLSFKSPIALASPAGIWLALCAGLGLAGAAYKLLLYPFFSRHAEYRITAVTPGPSSVQLELAPIGRDIPFEAGQFAFLRFLHAGLREPHPFTIASGTGAGKSVQFVIRALGGEAFVLSEESLDLAWRPVTEVASDPQSDESMQRMARRWLAR